MTKKQRPTWVIQEKKKRRMSDKKSNARRISFPFLASNRLWVDLSYDSHCVQQNSLCIAYTHSGEYILRNVWSSSNRRRIIYPWITNKRSLAATLVTATIKLPVSKRQKWAVLHFNVRTYITLHEYISPFDSKIHEKMVNFSLAHLFTTDLCIVYTVYALAYFAFLTLSPTRKA